MKSSELVDIVNNNRNKKVNAKKIIETNPSLVPVVSKLASDKDTKHNVDNETLFNLNKTTLSQLSHRVAEVKTNNKYIIQLFPDIELAIQILVSCILSPKTLSDITLNYKFSERLDLDPQVSVDILADVKEYIEDEYKLEERLPSIIREALFTSGAYIQAIVPEAAVDEIINADLLSTISTESFKARAEAIVDVITEPLNIVTYNPIKPKTPTPRTQQEFAEMLASESFFKITDNPSVLNFHKLKDKVSSDFIRKAYRKRSSITTEDREAINYLDLFRNRSSSTGHKEVEFIKSRLETKRSSVGKPMHIRFPTESVIPVFSPGNVEDHTGYIILLGANGRPINLDTNDQDIDRIADTLRSNPGNSSPIQKAYKNLVSNSTSGIDMSHLYEDYKLIVERQLFDAVKSSLYGKSVDIANVNSIYFHMFCRALQEQQTSILYIPKEQIVYYNFYYNELGLGKTLLDDLVILCSLRAILLFAKVMAHSKASIDVTNVEVTLDELDTDPKRTIDLIQSSVLKMRENFFPLGINNPIDLVSWIQQAGLRFSYNAIPGLPNVSLNFSNENIQHTIPDNDLDEELRKQTIIGLGLQPEVIDAAFTPDFAKGIVSNNALLTKRVTLYQRTLMTHTSKEVQLLIYNDQTLRSKIRELIEDKLPIIEKSLEEDMKALFNKDKEAFMEEYIDLLADGIYTELPKADEKDLENLTLEFNVYKEALLAALPSIVSDEILSEDVAGELSNHSGTISNLLLHSKLRKWMTDNNYMTELLDISTIDDEERTALLNNLSTHIVSTVRNGAELFKILKEVKLAANKDLEESLNGEDSSTASEGSGYGGDNEGDNKEGDDAAEDEDVDSMLDF